MIVDSSITCIHPVSNAGIIALGFDRPDELYCLIKDKRMVYIGYLEQCERAIPVHGGFLFKYDRKPLKIAYEQTNAH